MFTYLGYEDKRPKSNGYNVMVSFPFSDSKKDSSGGVNVTQVWMSADSFETHFAGVEFGHVFPESIGFAWQDYKEDKRPSGQYKAYIK